MSAERVSPKSIVLLLFICFAIGFGAGSVYLLDKVYLEPLREQKRVIANMKVMLEQLAKKERIAEVHVIDQTRNPLTTTFDFVEVDEHGNPLGQPKRIKIDGDVAYFDTQVIKFEQPFEQLDSLPLKDNDKKEVAQSFVRKSIIYFRRVFGEKQKPEDGFPLDNPGDTPTAYRSGGPEPKYEKQLWKQFWDLANDPELAKKNGVYAAHGDAPYMQLRKDKYYVLERRETGELSIVPKPLPAAMRPPGEPAASK